MVVVSGLLGAPRRKAGLILFLAADTLNRPEEIHANVYQ